MKYLEIQEFVRESRKIAREAGCMKCGRKVRLGLRGAPTLSTLARDGSGIEEIVTAVEERGWYCRRCSDKLTGTTAAATIRDQFPPGPEGEAEYRNEIFWRAYPEKRPTS